MTLGLTFIKTKSEKIEKLRKVRGEENPSSKVRRGIKHEWEPNLHLVPIPLVSNRSR